MATGLIHTSTSLRRQSAHRPAVPCRAVSVEKQKQSTTQHQSNNIAPFHHHSKSEDRAHPFVAVARHVTDLIISSWVQTGEDPILEDLGLSLIEAEGEDPTDLCPDSLEQRTQVHEMWADWDRFSA
jgi:hypothetical protein